MSNRRRQRRALRREIRREARDLLREGLSTQEVKQALDDEYGDLAEQAGFDPATWIQLIMMIIKILQELFDRDD